MDAAEAKVITDAALLWERMSLKRGITPAGLTRFPEEARLLRDVLIAAGANAGDDTAGLTNFLRRIRSFLKRDGGWLAAQNPDITDFLRACGAVTIDGTTVRILLPRLFRTRIPLPALKQLFLSFVKSAPSSAPRAAQRCRRKTRPSTPRRRRPLTPHLTRGVWRKL